MRNARNGPSNGRSGTGSIRPTRIITYAWGEDYVEALLSLTYPALLAPGNLPFVAAKAPCQIILLTEQRFFAAVEAHPSVLRAKKFCPVRLVALDDLITAKDKYGMALTHALHRGFSDLGPAMTEQWQIFLNADFILADGSLRNLLAHLARGERVVAAPSYCVNAKEIIPQLRRWIDPDTCALSLPAREMAALAIRYRHNTIRGKTVNQRPFSLRYKDQFYWLADEHTLLGHQMPVSIVGMQPERYLAQPNTYWDYGIIREFCPTADIHVIGDSDEFLMLELRESEVAQEQISADWPNPKDIAENMVVFLTGYQRDFARYPLTLHSDELPSDVEDARAKLRAFVDEVLSYLPVYLPSHLDHPQWDYHWPGFIAARHAIMSKQLGALTEASAPPASLPDIDKLWWKIDGNRKAHARQHSALVEIRDGQLNLLHTALSTNESYLGQGRAHISQQFLNGLLVQAQTVAAAEPHTGAPPSDYHGGDRRFANARTIADDSEWWRGILSRHQRDYEALQSRSAKSRELFDAAIRAITKHYEERLAVLNQTFEWSNRALEEEYKVLVNRAAVSAAIPFVRVQSGPSSPAPGRQRPTLTTRRLHQIVAAAAQRGARDVLIVDSKSGLIEDTTASLAGTHAWVSLAGLKSGNFAKAFARSPEFDLCICDLDPYEFPEFSDIVRLIRPFMRVGGRIIGCRLNRKVDLLPPDLSPVAFTVGQARIHHVQGNIVARALRWCLYTASLFLKLDYAGLVKVFRSLVRHPPLAVAISPPRERSTIIEIPVQPHDALSPIRHGANPPHLMA